MKRFRIWWLRARLRATIKGIQQLEAERFDRLLDLDFEAAVTRSVLLHQKRGKAATLRARLCALLPA